MHHLLIPIWTTDDRVVIVEIYTHTMVGVAVVTRLDIEKAILPTGSSLRVLVIVLGRSVQGLIDILI